jgi:hypothetical protein
MTALREMSSLICSSVNCRRRILWSLGRLLSAAAVDQGPWNGDRQQHGVSDKGERNIQAGRMRTLQFNVPDGARVNFVPGLLLPKGAKGGAAGQEERDTRGKAGPTKFILSQAALSCLDKN